MSQNVANNYTVNTEKIFIKLNYTTENRINIIKRLKQKGDKMQVPLLNLARQ